jgi:hypothetical protein
MFNEHPSESDIRRVLINTLVAELKERAEKNAGPYGSVRIHLEIACDKLVKKLMAIAFDEDIREDEDIPF